MFLDACALFWWKRFCVESLVYICSLDKGIGEMIIFIMFEKSGTEQFKMSTMKKHTHF